MKYSRMSVIFSLLAGLLFSQSVARDYSIVTMPQPAYKTALAAREIRRYFYLRTHSLPVSTESSTPPASGYSVVIGLPSEPLMSAALNGAQHASNAQSLKAEQYLLTVKKTPACTLLLVTGGDEQGVLYGAYALCRAMGVWFDLDGDVIPDAPFTDWTRLDTLYETVAPFFDTRGINPFHDFPEGPDWWDADDYLAVISQLSKMGMNFIGLHTYPWEPTVWIGDASNINADGTVKSSYQVSYYSNLKNTGYGYTPKNTSTYNYGASQLFDADGYVSDFMDGIVPEPSTPEECNRMFNKCGQNFNRIFTSAGKIGVKTCIGTETPLRIPKGVDLVDILSAYQGIFTRIKAAHPLDYYWIWTKEGATPNYAETMNNILTAYHAGKSIMPELKFATCGWSLGTDDMAAGLPADITMSAINPYFGRAPVEAGFGRISGRSKWAIPWLEDDLNLVAPQLWVKRVQRDAVLAQGYGNTGLIGIHWRTKVIGPQIAALAQLGWNPNGWSADTFYDKWAKAHFGGEAGPSIGAIFARIDGALPEPSTWDDGPGSIRGGGDYSFVSELESLRSQVQGAGNLSRFDYWLNTFRYMKALGSIDKPSMWKYLLSSLSTKGELGTLANLENHNYPSLMGTGAYSGDFARIVLLTTRSQLEENETLQITLRALDAGQPVSVRVLWRLLGQNAFDTLACAHVNRGVYSAEFPPALSDFEYFVEMESSNHVILRHPNTAPTICQTVIVMAGNGSTQDTVKPFVTAIQVLMTSVRISFSEKVELTSSKNIDNYTINNGIQITAASRQKDQKTVMLSVSPLAMGTIYSLRVAGIRDLSAIPNTMNTFDTSVILPNLITINITADNVYDLFVNGRLIGSNNNWQNVENYTVELQPGKNVIAVKAVDLGAPAGLLADIIWLTYRYGTNVDWKTSMQEQAEWNTTSFDDVSWAPATVIGACGIAPWGNLSGIPAGTTAQWIWGAGSPATVYFRYVIDVPSTVNEPAGFTPENLALTASPNPFNQSARISISYYLPQKASVTLTLYNPQGKMVRKLISGMTSAGRHSTQVETGGLASGIYVCEFKSGAIAKRLKLVLMR